MVPSSRTVVTGRPRRGSLAPEEGQQVGVELVLKCGGEAVRRTRVVDLLRALDEPGGFPGRVLDGNDLIVLAVQDQSRDIELLEVSAKSASEKALMES